MVVNKHQKKSEATRRKLLEAGLRVFARDGFEAASLEDIAQESGHTRGAFYANFDTKEDLFLALMEQEGEERMEDLRKRLEAYESREERVRVMREFYMERAHDRPNVLLILEFKMFALRHPKLRSRLAEAQRRIHASLSYEAIKKLLPVRHGEELPEADKILLQVVLTGLVLEHAYDPKRLPTKEMSATLGRFFDIIVS